MMKPQFDITQIEYFRSYQKLPLQCEYCNKTFYEKPANIRLVLNRSLSELKFCSIKCFNATRIKTTSVSCSSCNNSFLIKESQRKKSKSGNHFCSKSCAAQYNNSHKMHGVRRSKLEIWLEQQLKTLYPDLEIVFNNKEIINSELDIYIPTLKIAFELNGIFHYEPIYGIDKLNKIQNNDNRKFQACLEKNIELVIIDSSGLKYFKPIHAQKYLDIITDIINVKTSG